MHSSAVESHYTPSQSVLVWIIFISLLLKLNSSSFTIFAIIRIGGNKAVKFPGHYYYLAFKLTSPSPKDIRFFKKLTIIYLPQWSINLNTKLWIQCILKAFSLNLCSWHFETGPKARLHYESEQWNCTLFLFPTSTRSVWNYTYREINQQIYCTDNFNQYSTKT